VFYKTGKTGQITKIMQQLALTTVTFLIEVDILASETKTEYKAKQIGGHNALKVMEK
jgi:hypothetical protein